MATWMGVGLVGLVLLGLGLCAPLRPRLWGPGLVLLGIAVVLQGRAKGTGIPDLYGADPVGLGALATVCFQVFWMTVKEEYLRCPQCKVVGLEREERVLWAATMYSKGKVRRVADCPACRWHEDKEVETDRLRPPGKRY